MRGTSISETKGVAASGYDTTSSTSTRARRFSPERTPQARQPRDPPLSNARQRPSRSAGVARPWSAQPTPPGPPALLEHHSAEFTPTFLRMTECFPTRYVAPLSWRPRPKERRRPRSHPARPHQPPSKLVPSPPIKIHASPPPFKKRGRRSPVECAAHSTRPAHIVPIHVGRASRPSV
jgi:hypothetical protein